MQARQIFCLVVYIERSGVRKQRSGRSMVETIDYGAYVRRSREIKSNKEVKKRKKLRDYRSYAGYVNTHMSSSCSSDNVVIIFQIHAEIATVLWNVHVLR